MISPEQKDELKPLFSEECVFNIDILMRKVKPIIYPYAYTYYTTYIGSYFRKIQS